MWLIINNGLRNFMSLWTILWVHEWFCDRLSAFVSEWATLWPCEPNVSCFLLPWTITWKMWSVTSQSGQHINQCYFSPSAANTTNESSLRRSACVDEAMAFSHVRELQPQNGHTMDKTTEFEMATGTCTVREYWCSYKKTLSASLSRGRLDTNQRHPRLWTLTYWASSSLRTSVWSFI